MKTNKTYLILIVLCVLSTFGCYDNSEETKKTVIIKDAPEVVIDHNLVGIVNDQDQKPLNDISIQYGTTTENINTSFFHINAIRVDKYFEALKISYDGLTLHYPYPMIENTTNYGQYLVPTNLTSENISPSNDLLIPIDASTSMTITSNSYTKNGNVLTAPLTIRHISFDYKANQLYPGGSLIQNNDGDFKLLLPKRYFIIDIDDDIMFDGTIELEGEKLYHYNEAYGFWRIVSSEEDIKQINSHGLYVIGNHTNHVEVSGEISGENIVFNGETFNIQGSLNNQIYTTSDGQFITYASTNEDIKILLDKECGVQPQTISVQEIALLEEEVQFEVAPIHKHVIRGEIRDCLNNDVESSILKINIDNDDTPIIKAIDKTAFSIDLITCQSIDAIVLESQLTNGDQKSQNLVFEAKDTIDVYHVFVCDEYDEDFITIEIDGNTSILQQGIAKDINGQLSIAFSNEEVSIDFVTRSMRKGTFIDEDLNIILNAPNLGDLGYELQCGTSSSGCGFEKFVITEYGSNENDYIRGYYKGRFWVKTFKPIVTAGNKNIEGVFHIRRSF